MKLSFVLTFGVLTAGLLAAAGCGQRLASLRQPVVETASASSPQQRIEPIVLTPSNNVAPVSESEIDSEAKSHSSEVGVTVHEPPPRPQVEVLGTPPSRNVTWLPGHWEWDGSWNWRSGRWIAMPKPNAAWVPGRWVRQDEGWVWVEGYWRMAALKQ